MKLYLIEQDVNNDYDTYDSAVVAAETKEEARLTHPGFAAPAPWDGIDSEGREGCGYGTWCNAEYVKVKYIGEADPSISKGVLVASFNAG
jgi:hypothetical protein